MLVGAPPIEVFREAIRDALKEPESSSEETRVSTPPVSFFADSDKVPWVERRPGVF